MRYNFIILIIRKSGMSSPFYVAFGVDDRYVPKMCATIVSIVENNRQTAFVFNVFTNEISDVNRKKLVLMEKRIGHKITVFPIDLSKVNLPDVSALSYFSPAIFLRLYIAEKLSGQTDRVLYLDADILCNGDISELKNREFGENNVAMAVEDTEYTSAYQLKRLKLPAGKYFNSGVLLIHVDRWNAEEISERALRELVTHGNTLGFPDQDALNLVLQGKVRFLDRSWNYMPELEKVGHVEMDVRLPEGIRFIHFAGRIKPWHAFNPARNMRNLFLKYLNGTEWQRDGLDMPKNYKQMHLYANYLLKNREVTSGLGWYMKYLWAKYLKFTY